MTLRGGEFLIYYYFLPKLVPYWIFNKEWCFHNSFDNLFHLKMLELNLRGEMKVAALRDSSFLKDLSLVGKLADAMKLSSVEVTRLNLVYFIFFYNSSALCSRYCQWNDILQLIDWLVQLFLYPLVLGIRIAEKHHFACDVLCCCPTSEHRWTQDSCQFCKKVLCYMTSTVIWLSSYFNFIIGYLFKQLLVSYHL